MFATYLEFLFCLLMVAFSRVSFSTQIVSLIKQKADSLRLSFYLNLQCRGSQFYELFMDFQVSRTLSIGQTMYCISYTVYHKPVDSSGEFGWHQPWCTKAGSAKKGCCHAFLQEKNKGQKSKAKTSCMSEIVKSCGNQMLSKHDLKVGLSPSKRVSALLCKYHK